MAHFSSLEERDAAVAQERGFQRQRMIRLQRRAQQTPHARATRHRVLLQALEGSRSKWAADTLRWYQAALLTSVAPKAWKGTTWVDCGRGRFAICLSEDAGSDGIAAFVTLDRLSTDQLAIIRAHVDTVDAKVQAGEFDGWYDACRTLLRTEANHLWLGQEYLPTLHPAQHLFAVRWMSD